MNVDHNFATTVVARNVGHANNAMAVIELTNSSAMRTKRAIHPMIIGVVIIVNAWMKSNCHLQQGD
jgi:hypothetical protein